MSQHSSSDQVNKPAHYTEGEVECIDAIESAVKGLPAFEAVCVGHIIRYVWRYRQKHPEDPSVDVRKAGYYFKKLIKELEKSRDNDRL